MQTAYWNSNVHLNREVQVLEFDGTNYSVVYAGRLYLIPKENVSFEPKVVETTAPRPEEKYWFTLTAKEREAIVAYRTSSWYTDDPWDNVVAEIKKQSHTGTYTHEWFSLTVERATALLDLYSYRANKHRGDFSAYLPNGEAHRTIVRQLWEEQLRRDGVVQG